MADPRFKKPSIFAEGRLLKNNTLSVPISNNRLNPTQSQAACSTLRAGGYRNKVVLKPGYSALDWYELTTKKGKKFGLVTNVDRLLTKDFDHLKAINYPQTLIQISRNVPLYLVRPPLRVDKELLQRHKTKDDCWCVIQGKVYCLTNYFDFHPGGVDILLKNCAGKDATVLFNKYHRWVSYDKLLENCFVGVYVG
ncbi:hypothetical protein ZYGM_002685 [Zygosaccharomyces mellis]|uniref:Cytochrome b5 heme-binding domain-containing protein n=1 Tax=Zygosaccharomyces mellis TaxID=42258 RepID=A0A4C2E866_9SACH|nr:hypothetical protein ZYGM_002685 [Zygosaccharomyces mellis]